MAYGVGGICRGVESMECIACHNVSLRHEGVNGMGCVACHNVGIVGA